MEKQQLEAILFDAVGTLIHLKAPVGKIYLERAQRFGFEASDRQIAAKLDASFRTAFRRQGPLAFPTREAAEIPGLEREWWRSVVLGTFASHGTIPYFNTFYEDLFEMFGTGEPWRLDQDARAVLSAFKDRTVKIGLVTNYDSRVFNVLDNLGIRSFFDVITISSQVGAAKPDPAIFAAACEALSSTPALTCHIGDDPEEDWEGAKRAGLKAILYDPDGRRAHLNAPRLSRLADLVPALL
ncbi:MAG TPA: HAD-IA family hydrolase [Acidobacteriota bacterium]|nr:HAD-IA family hydrolase [Acidobacteriota bacterium]